LRGNVKIAFYFPKTFYHTVNPKEHKRFVKGTQETEKNQRNKRKKYIKNTNNIDKRINCGVEHYGPRA